MTIDPQFWHERWRDGNTPWHRAAPSERLTTCFGKLPVAAGVQVFVPLCGRSVDMRWLLERQYRVLGVELSEVAARQFFDDHGLRINACERHGLPALEAPGIQILCADVFALTAEHLAEVAVVYDRGALVALDDADQARYAGMLCERLPAGASQLLLTLEYDPTRMQGPPFSVDEVRVRTLYGQRFQIARVDSAEVLDQEPHLRERGLDALSEHAFVLTEPKLRA